MLKILKDMTMVSLSYATDASVHADGTGYMAGALIAIIILGYLVYALLNPEKL